MLARELSWYVLQALDAVAGSPALAQQVTGLQASRFGTATSAGAISGLKGSDLVSHRPTRTPITNSLEEPYL